tara:strand:+ start:1108 stop:1812 length:705 start_codon:yes stop_codon:yes gene_type:complete
MIIIPAIDIYQGQVVRLLKGNPDKSTIYSDDPLAMAKEWQSLGAELLHLVDLSAALDQGDNLSIIKDILKSINIKVQVGGGIRDLSKAKELIALGAERVIIGTKSLDSDFLDNLIQAVGPERIAVGVDVIDSCLAVKGWQEKTDLRALDFISQLKDKGIKWIIYTDISRDGTLIGLDFNQINELAKFKDLNIIASGGVACEDDFKRLKDDFPFIWGAIVGKALYEGKITLVPSP